jgi:hypothetical protein
VDSSADELPASQVATGIARLLVLAVLFGKICFCEKCGYSALVEKIPQ